MKTIAREELLLYSFAYTAMRSFLIKLRQKLFLFAWGKKRFESGVVNTLSLIARKLGMPFSFPELGECDLGGMYYSFSGKKNFRMNVYWPALPMPRLEGSSELVIEITYLNRRQKRVAMKYARMLGQYLRLPVRLRLANLRKRHF
jgi:hypothetical protein